MSERSEPEEHVDLTYASYLKLDELLGLQEPRSVPEQHDEMLFIVIHQVYELWFRLLLHEFEKVRRDFRAGALWGAIDTFKRIRTVMKTLVGQLDILETMTPRSFAAFRDRLEAASGFQSVQFREVEFLVGYKRPEMMRYYPAGSVGLDSLARRLREPSLMDAFYDLIEQLGVEIPEDLRAKRAEEANRPDERIQDGLVRLYDERPDVRVLLESMTDFDEGMQEWRYRHVKMVERTIGNKHGTGGSLGAAFLRKTLFHPIFPDLWAIRHRF
jgi:tryptophan 2,3-dioxygenase